MNQCYLTDRFCQIPSVTASMKAFEAFGADTFGKAYTQAQLYHQEFGVVMPQEQLQLLYKGAGILVDARRHEIGESNRTLLLAIAGKIDLLHRPQIKWMIEKAKSNR